MRIFTNKSFEFKNAAGEKVVTQPLSFADVPDWVVDDPIFGWGKKDGDITVTETPKEEAAAEKAAEDVKPEAPKAEAEPKTKAADKAANK